MGSPHRLNQILGTEEEQIARRNDAEKPESLLQLFFIDLHFNLKRIFDFFSSFAYHASPCSLSFYPINGTMSQGLSEPGVYRV